MHPLIIANGCTQPQQMVFCPLASKGSAEELTGCTSQERSEVGEANETGGCFKTGQWQAMCPWRLPGFPASISGSAAVFGEVCCCFFLAGALPAGPHFPISGLICVTSRKTTLSVGFGCEHA